MMKFVFPLLLLDSLHYLFIANNHQINLFFVGVNLPLKTLCEYAHYSGSN